MKLRDKKGSISIFVLVMLLFMSAFLIISFASNVNKSKAVKEQFNIINGIYSYGGGDKAAYDKSYTDLRNKNKQTMTATSQGTEDTSTLELTKTFYENMSNYRIYGNSIQDTANGNPSPSNPVEVQSVGELSINMLENKNITKTVNGVTFTHNPDDSITMNGTATANITYEVNSENAAFNIPLTAGVSYYISYGSITLPKGIYLQAYYRENNNPFYKTSPTTFTTSIDTNARVYIRFDNGVTANNITIYPQIEEGTSATSYEPYGKYKIPVKVSGKNFINNIMPTQTINGITFTHNSDGSITMNGTNTSTTNFTVPIVGETTWINLVIPLSANTTYTLSGGVNLPTGVVMQSHGKVNGVSEYKTYKENKPITFTTAEETLWSCYLNILSGAVLDNVTIYPQLEEGETATSYESYVEPITTNIFLDEPLRGIGNVADYIDFKNQEVVRNVIEKVLTGEEVFSLLDSGKTSARVFTVLDDKLSGVNVGLCSHFENLRSVDSNPNSCDFNSIYFRVNVSQMAISSVSDWTDYLKKQYSNGTPVKITYSLATPSEKPIDLSRLKTFEDYTKIEILTEVAPSNIEVKYKGYDLE